MKGLPPQLHLRNLARQAGALLALRLLVGWRHLGRWTLRDGLRTIPVAAGSVGMGCIGFPYHPVIEVTSKCNLSCIHCHVGSSSLGVSPPFEELARLIRGISQIPEFRMVVFTGGEPLVREDLPELAQVAKGVGLPVVIATNATLIDDGTARVLRRSGVVGAAISLDAVDPGLHDRIRGKRGAFEEVMRGIEACQRAGIVVQINITAMKENADHIAEVLRWSHRKGAEIGLVYQLVPVGRGERIRDRALLVEENRRLMRTLREVQREIKTVFEPVASPQYWAYLLASGSSNLGRRLGGWTFRGCTAGWGMLYVKADGDVWPCPFVPLSAGNAFEGDIGEIWLRGEVFRLLRDRRNLKGNCGSCRWREVCGGCRGKALAYSGDLLAEDPTCFVREDYPSSL